jgi:hypothetical protein
LPTLISLWAIAIAALACAAVTLLGYALILRYRHALTMRLVPTARAGLADDASPPDESVCVIVPAHNESAVICALVRSLRAIEHPRLRVLLALDRCTDDTEAIARRESAGDERFRIVPVTQCPPDWAGKVNAIWTAVNQPEARSADALLFVDADTSLDPRCLKATLSLMRRRGLDLLSLLSTLTVGAWFERVVQPAAALELIYQFPLVRANKPDTPRPFANGQYMLFRANAYRDVGGHAAVKDELLEDLALARLVRDRGLRAGVFLADGLLTCRMYPDYPAFRRGWKRIYIESAKRKPGRLARSAWRLRLLNAALPVASASLMILAGAALILRPSGMDLTAPAVGLALALAALSAWALALGRLYATGGFPRWAVAFSPWAAWLVSGVLLEAARDLRRGEPVRWGGREYVREAR